MLNSPVRLLAELRYLYDFGALENQFEQDSALATYAPSFMQARIGDASCGQ